MDVLHFEPRTNKFLNGYIKFLVISPLAKNSFTTKLCAISILIIIFSTFCFEVYGRWKINFEHYVKSTRRSIIVGALNTLIDVACNIVITLPVFVFSEGFKEDLFYKINHVDTKLKKYVKVHQRRRFFLIHLIILNVFYFSVLCNDIVTWFFTMKQVDVFFYYCFDQFYRYRISLLVLYIYHLMRILLEKIMAINALLRNAFEEACERTDELRCSKTLAHLEEVTKDISESYAAFTDIINFVNRAFGWQILFALLNYIFLFIVTYEAGLRIATFDGDPSGFSIWSLSTMAYATVSAATVISTCSKITKEARKTADLSFYYYYSTNISKRHPRQACLMENLIVLIRQTRSSLTTFSAAGFFPLDYSTLFLLINLLTSYLVVLIQFE